jgi:hypothetical protein
MLPITEVDMQLLEYYLTFICGLHTREPQPHARPRRSNPSPPYRRAGLAPPFPQAWPGSLTRSVLEAVPRVCNGNSFDKMMCSRIAWE